MSRSARASWRPASRDYDGVVCLLTDRLDASVLEANPQLEVVSNVAVGFDNIDVPVARQLGITVTNTPDVLTETTADLTLALMLAVARRLPEADGFVRSGVVDLLEAVPVADGRGPVRPDARTLRNGQNRPRGRTEGRARFRDAAALCITEPAAGGGGTGAPRDPRGARRSAERRRRRESARRADAGDPARSRGRPVRGHEALGDPGQHRARPARRRGGPGRGPGERADLGGRPGRLRERAGRSIRACWPSGNAWSSPRTSAARPSTPGGGWPTSPLATHGRCWRAELPRIRSRPEHATCALTTTGDLSTVVMLLSTATRYAVERRGGVS